MSVSGESIIAGQMVKGSGDIFRVVDPATMEPLDPEFGTVVSDEADAAVRAANAAFDSFRATSPERRARFLESIADNLESVRSDIVLRASAETGLPAGRIEGELTRTTNQLRLFATELMLGEHQGVRIDHARPERVPVPAPDVRQRMIALGPVVVFGASNFPLAFSVAGGDTASALAAGCPVVVKAHSSHAGTAELAGRAIASAVASNDLPAGVFSMVFGPGPVVGTFLAAHPDIKAIAFTGSQAAGLDLMRVAANRPEPIPVYAEMSSINPVVWLPSIGSSDVQARAAAFVASLTLGSGQFCTNPGLIFVSEECSAAVDAIRDAVIESHGQTMLSGKICTSYREGLDRLRRLQISPLAEGLVGPNSNAPQPAVFECPASRFLEVRDLQEEVFGAAAIVVTYGSAAELVDCLEALQGQLTATVHFGPEDYPMVATLLPILERKAGRIIANGWPTGVEVNHSMVHGGPFPATSDSRVTSVGSLAIMRFQRPVAYQDFPTDLLPQAVRDDNPLRIPQRIAD